MAAPEKEGLDTPLRGSGRLESGWHDVTIMSVETDRLADQGRITVVFDKQGVYHKEFFWILTRDKTKLSHSFKTLVEGVFGDHSVDYIQHLEGPYQADIFQVLRGMKLSIDIQPGPGYTVHLSGGEYVAMDVTLGIPLTKPMSDVYKVRREAERMGLKRSYNKLRNTEATFADDNFEAFQNACEAILLASGSDGTSESEVERG